MPALPRLLVVVGAGASPRLLDGPGYAVVREEDLTKCHHRGEVDRAVRQGAAYVTLSPVAVSASKPGYGPPLGEDGIRAAVMAAGAVPVFALGGVTVENARGFLAAGAYGVAVMGPVARAEDPAAVVAAYLAVLG